MQVLPERPGIAEESAKIGEVKQPVGTRAVPDRVLHERVGGDDEVAREPRPHEQGHGHRQVTELAESLLAEEEQPEERGLEDECEHALDREGLAHDLASVSGEARQFVPNWNSSGIPVTTPMAKLSAKIRVQNRATSLNRSSPTRSARALKMTIKSASPIVSCGNR